MKSPLLARAAAIALITAFILVPIGLIKGKISERQARADSVVQQFAAETSRPQVVAGPFLAATCEETVSESKTLRCPTAYFAPRAFKAAAAMPIESRHRGIYPIRLYHADLQLTGEFEWPAPAVPSGANARAWKRMYVVIAVSDSRGIKTIVSSLSPTLTAAAEDKTLAQFALREDLGGYATRKAGTRLAFAYKMGLVGTSSLQVAPVGDVSEIRLASDWPHPAFTEAWTPDERRVAPDGFEATWRITSIATGGEATWQALASGEKVLTARAAGVSLFDPVNVYSLSYRATEYAFLFVLFTFGALALAEATAGVRLHPVQYALTGSAIAVFFLLLIALSEHVSFRAAYASAATGSVVLLTYYLRHPLGTTSRAAAFGALFVGLYGGLYLLLKSEDNALLMGSIMVFVLLAAAMVATRRLDWSAMSISLAQ